MCASSVYAVSGVCVVSRDSRQPRPLSTIVKPSTLGEPMSRARVLAAMMDKVAEIAESATETQPADDRLVQWLPALLCFGVLIVYLVCCITVVCCSMVSGPIFARPADVSVTNTSMFASPATPHIRNQSLIKIDANKSRTAADVLALLKCPQIQHISANQSVASPATPSVIPQSILRRSAQKTVTTPSTTPAKHWAMKQIKNKLSGTH